MNPRDPNVAYCRRCEEYHKANEEEDIDQLIADCEAGNW